MCCCCFPSSALVWLTTGSHLISKLSPDDVAETLIISKNQVNSFSESQFITYLHFDTEKTAEFILLKCENGKTLTISPDHLLFTGDSKYKNGVRAKNIKIGDELISVENKSKNLVFTRVEEIKREEFKGVFAPLTSTGTMIVDGFLVSCYANVDSHSKAHKVLAPLRLLSKKSQTNKNWGIVRENRGIHPYAIFLMKFTQFFRINN